MNKNSFIINLFRERSAGKNINIKLIPDKSKNPSSVEPSDYLGDCACSMEDDNHKKLNEKNNNGENKPKIFISYAHEDKEIVKNIYNQLKNAGCDPWMDDEDLLPGENWKAEIYKVMRTLDFVLVCLSQNSIPKIGEVQAEWKELTKISAKYPDRSVFIIPMLLDNSEIPERFEELHSVHIYDENWISRILATIFNQMTLRGKKVGKRLYHSQKERKKVKIEFINREHEKDEIKNPGGPQFVGIDAPPGYGKSRLLDEIEDWYKTEKKDEWICVRININEKVTNYSNDPAAVLYDIANQVVAGKNIIHTSEELIAQIINDGQNIILLFDAIESNPLAVEWLQSKFIQILWNKMKVTRLMCRVVFAGRYIQNPRRDWQDQQIEWDWTNYKIVKLTVLDFNVVRQAILKELKGGYLREAQQEVLTREIAFLSGGHPGIIEQMLHNPPNGNWALAFHENQISQQTRKELFNRYAKPVIDAILAEIQQKELRDMLKILTIFRRFNFNTIRALQKLTAKKTDESGIQKILNKFVGETNLKELVKAFSVAIDDALVTITNLVNTGLVSAPTSEKPFYHDAIIRKLILIQLQIEENNERCPKLHALAHGIYETWLTNKNVDGRELSPPLADNFQIECIAENFYHLLNCLKCEKRSQNIRVVKSKLRSYKKMLRSSFDTPKSVLQVNLKTILKQDEDIPHLLRKLFGDDGVKQIFALLD